LFEHDFTRKLRQNQTMTEKEIKLLREQLSRLSDSKVEFEVWKNQTLFVLEMIFSGSSSEVKILLS
jgi:hypothetical protein